MWLSVPLRSLWRNRRRTILSIAVVSLGTAVSLIVLGFVEDSRGQIQQTTVEEFGNLQIASSDLWNETADDYEYLIPPETLDQIEALLAVDPAYVGRTTRLQFPGLLASGSRTQVVQAVAIEPGNGVLDSSSSIVSGRDLADEDTAAVLIGRSLADRLSLDVGDPLIFTLTTAAGAYNATPLIVTGIYRFQSEDAELRTIFLPLAFGQLLFGTSGVDRVVVGLSDLAKTDGARNRIQAGLDSAGITLEVKTWYELSPFYEQLSGFFDALFGFLTLAVTVLVFFIILQVLTLSFLERTREIGTLRALGTTQGEVFRMFFVESAWLALLGALVGVAAGVLFSIAFNAVGIEWRPPGTVDPVTFTIVLAPMTVVPPFVVGIVATLISGLFPSIRTSRIRVVDALRVE
ncbi:ABC transporter permease [Candidatus Bipolaricaulota bacterium]